MDSSSSEEDGDSFLDSSSSSDEKKNKTESLLASSSDEKKYVENPLSQPHATGTEPLPRTVSAFQTKIPSRKESTISGILADDTTTTLRREDITDTYKICIAGESGVGKSSLLRRYCTSEFEPNTTKSTVGIDFLEKLLRIDRTAISFQLWDTAGQERFASLTQTYFRGAQGLVCVFDLTQHDTLDKLDRWIDEFYRVLGKRSDHSEEDPPPILLLGNKCDVTPSDPTDRTILVQQARSRAQFNQWYFFTVSAKENTNVTEALDSFLRIVHEKVLQTRQIARLSRDFHSVATASPDTRRRLLDATRMAAFGRTTRIEVVHANGGETATGGQTFVRTVNDQTGTSTVLESRRSRSRDPPVVVDPAEEERHLRQQEEEHIQAARKLREQRWALEIPAPNDTPSVPPPLVDLRIIRLKTTTNHEEQSYAQQCCVVQ